MPEPLKPQPGSSDFQTSALEPIILIPLAFRDEDTFIIEIEDPE